MSISARGRRSAPARNQLARQQCHGLRDSAEPLLAGLRSLDSNDNGLRTAASSDGDGRGWELFFSICPRELRCPEEVKRQRCRRTRLLEESSLCGRYDRRSDRIYELNRRPGDDQLLCAAFRRIDLYGVGVRRKTLFT